MISRQVGSPFPHRLNKNGFFDSICPECCLTIASTRDESALINYEIDHVCNPIRLYHLRQDQLHTHTPAFPG
jgi:hypothetical protein